MRDRISHVTDGIHPRILRKSRKYYYLINGTWEGAWEGLPKDVVIMSWQRSVDGLKFFQDRGEKQILCGYYDARNTDAMKRNISGWKKDSKDIKDILGFMYCQWSSGYGNMKEYFQLLDTYDQWKPAGN